MKNVIQDSEYGEIVYQESFFSGSKSVTVNGNALEKVSKKEFKMPNGNPATVNGGFLYGVNLVTEGKTVSLMPRIKWYEIVLAVIPFLLVLIWGNILSLCLIVPIVGGIVGGVAGGAVGGGVSALASILGLLGIRCVKPIWQKILIGLAAIGVAFGVCCGLGYAFLL